MIFTYMSFLIRKDHENFLHDDERVDSSVPNLFSAVQPVSKESISFQLDRTTRSSINKKKKNERCCWSSVQCWTLETSFKIKPSRTFT